MKKKSHLKINESCGEKKNHVEINTLFGLKKREKHFTRESHVEFM